MSKKHLSAESRRILENCLSQGYSFRQCAKIIGYSVVTVYKEYNRNRKGEVYIAEDAHKMACLKRKQSVGKQRVLAEKLESYIFEKMRFLWSPEQVCGRLAIEFKDDPDMQICFKTIYRKIAIGVKKSNPWSELHHCLRFKRQPRSLINHSSRPQGKQEALPSIEDRPAIVAAKERFGDLESDLICGSKGKGNIATLVERLTQFLFAAECPRKTPFCYKEVALKVLGHLPKGIIHTLTVDRGAEFFEYKEISAELGIEFFFCHPRNPNERGLNEQVNGLLRQFFPKNRPLIDIKDELARAVELINNRPRKRLGYKTPTEMIILLGMQEVLTLS